MTGTACCSRSASRRTSRTRSTGCTADRGVAGAERDGGGVVGDRRDREAARARALAGGSRSRCSGRSTPRRTTCRDGSLFVPAVLLAKHKPFDSLTRSRLRELLEPGHAVRARIRLLRPEGHTGEPDPAHMTGHGSRLLGCPRGRVLALRRKERGRRAAPTRSTGLAMARFLADNDDPDQLVLSLYGMLGAAMTPTPSSPARRRRRAAARALLTGRCTSRRTPRRTGRSWRRCA